MESVPHSTPQFSIPQNHPDRLLEQSPGYLEYVRNPQNGYLSLTLPFEAGRGNELTIVTR
jgi:hypothetical protein